MRKLTLPFFLWSLPVHAATTFPAPICVTQKVVTAKGVFDSTDIGDCTWS
jgi:hypothetical protein